MPVPAGATLIQEENHQDEKHPRLHGISALNWALDYLHAADCDLYSRHRGTFLATLDATYLDGEVAAPGSSASRKVSVVSSRHALIPMVLQLTVIVFLATTSEFST